MLRLLAILCITLTGVAARAGGTCFSMAFLAAGGEPSPELVERTYFELFDALAKEVGPDAHKAIAASGNPFQLPAEVNAKKREPR